MGECERAKTGAETADKNNCFHDVVEMLEVGIGGEKSGFLFFWKKKENWESVLKML